MSRYRGPLILLRTSSSKGACVGVVAEDEPVGAAETSLNHPNSTNITAEHMYNYST